MRGLIGDRFLKFFFPRNRYHCQKDTLAEPAMTFTDKAVEAPVEGSDPIGQELPKKEALLENENKGDNNNDTGAENAPDQLASEFHSLVENK